MKYYLADVSSENANLNQQAHFVYSSPAESTVNLFSVNIVFLLVSAKMGCNSMDWKHLAHAQGLCCTGLGVEGPIKVVIGH